MRADELPKWQHDFLHAERPHQLWERFHCAHTRTHTRARTRAHYTLSSLSLKESSGSNFRIIAVDLQLSSVCSFTLQVMNGYCKDILWLEALLISPSLSSSPARSLLICRPMTPLWPSMPGSTVASQREEPAWWRLCRSDSLCTLIPLAKKALYRWL